MLIRKIFIIILLTGVISLCLNIILLIKKFDLNLNSQLDSNGHSSGWKDDGIIKDEVNNQENYNDLNFKNIYCKKADLSFADAIARKFMGERRRFGECTDIDKFVTLIENEVNKNFQINLNITIILRKYHLNENELACKLSLFDRIYNISESENYLNFINQTKFEKSSNYTIVFTYHGFYNLSCFKIKNTTSILIYEDNYCIFPHNMSKLIDDKNLFKGYLSIETEEQNITFLDKINHEKLAQEKMNVLLIGIDSMSYPHFQRSMPNTFNYLKNELENNIIYSSINKVGENTLPNIIAMLAGVSYEGFESDSIKVNMEKEKYENLANKFADKNPFIFYEYENAGYITGYQVFKYIKKDNNNFKQFSFERRKVDLLFSHSSISKTGSNSNLLIFMVNHFGQIKIEILNVVENHCTDYSWTLLILL